MDDASVAEGGTLTDCEGAAGAEAKAEGEADISVDRVGADEDVPPTIEDESSAVADGDAAAVAIAVAVAEDKALAVAVAEDDALAVDVAEHDGCTASPGMLHVLHVHGTGATDPSGQKLPIGHCLIVVFVVPAGQKLPAGHA